MRAMLLTAICCAAWATLSAATERPPIPYAPQPAESRTALEMALAQRDSASAAWAVAQHRIDVLEAVAAREAAQDSVQLAQVNAWWQSRLDDRNAEIKRAYVVALVTAATCAGIYFAAATR